MNSIFEVTLSNGRGRKASYQKTIYVPASQVKERIAMEADARSDWKWAHIEKWVDPLDCYGREDTARKLKAALDRAIEIELKRPLEPQAFQGLDDMIGGR